MIQDTNQQNINQNVPWPVKNQHNLAENYGPGERIKVRCIAPQGIYYDFARRREGDVFELIPQYITIYDTKTRKPVMENGKIKKRLVAAIDQFSEATMELVDEATPDSFSTAQQSVNKTTEQLIKDKAASKR